MGSGLSLCLGGCLQHLFLQAQQEEEPCMEPERCWCDLGVRTAELWVQPLLEQSGTECIVSAMSATSPVACGTSSRGSLKGSGLHQAALCQLDLLVLFLQVLTDSAAFLQGRHRLTECQCLDGLVGTSPAGKWGQGEPGVCREVSVRYVLQTQRHANRPWC